MLNWSIAALLAVIGYLSLGARLSVIDPHLQPA